MRKISLLFIFLLGTVFAAEKYLDVPVYAPYLGQHTMAQSRDLNNALELGIIASKKIADNLFIELNAGLIPTKIISSQKDSWNLALGANLLYEIAQMDKFAPYILGGIGTDIGHNSFLGMNLGLGVKWKMNAYLQPRFEVKNIYYGDKGLDTVVSVILYWPPIVNELEEQYRAKGKVDKLDMKINFESGKTTIAPEYVAELEKYAVFMKNHPEVKIAISGFTDNQGAEDYNMTLSKARAQAVADALSDTYGVAKERIKTEGFGPAQPVASNDTEEGRAMNRRIEASTF